MIGRLSLRSRAAALVPLGALAVHDLRYRLAFGGDASRELAHQGHAYLAWLTPLVGVLCALAGAEVLTRLARAWRTGEENEAPVGRVRLGAAVVGALLAVFACQELLEGALFTGHPDGLAAVVGSGGWIAAPLSVVVGVVISLALVGAQAVARAIARRRRPAALRVLSAPRLRLPRAVVRRPAPLASSAAGRAPPRAASIPL